MAKCDICSTVLNWEVTLEAIESLPSRLGLALHPPETVQGQTLRKVCSLCLDLRPVET